MLSKFFFNKSDKTNIPPDQEIYDFLKGLTDDKQQWESSKEDQKNA